MRIDVSKNLVRENPVVGSNNGVVERLQKQIESVQKQIAELSKDSTMDPKLKQERQKALESEIQTLKQQIMREQEKRQSRRRKLRK